MKMKITHSAGYLAAAATFLAAGLAQALTPLGTVFTYQGRLTDNGSPANGNYSMTFTLYDAAAGGSIVGLPIGPLNVAVTDGLFTEELDFGASAFNGEARWLEIDVNGTPLSPRQELTAAPYATFAALPWETAGGNISYNAGNVGIGTASPQARLHIDGAPGVDGIMFPDGTLQTTAPTGGPGFWSPNGSHIFNNNAGNVGIGTSAPFAPLHVYSTTASAGDNTAHFTAAGIGPHASHIHFGTTGDWYIRSASGSGKVVMQDSGGNVGIGTATPSHPLTVNAFAYGLVHTYSGTELGTYVDFSAGWLGTRSNHPLYFFTNDSFSRMTLSAAGNLGVGLTAPLRRLHTLASDLFVSRFEGTHTTASVVEFRNSTSNATWEYGVSGTASAFGLPPGSAYFYRQGNGVPTISMTPDNNAQVHGRLKCNVLEILGADVAEKFPSSDKQVEPGTVMEIDPENAGQLRVARQAYSTRVAGVVSGAGGLSVGAVLGNLPENEGGPPIALSGRVWVHCDASSGAIAPGDLLTTSDTPGHAMKAVERERSHGAILGKAMTSLPQSEKGLVLVLVNLQ